MTLEEAERWLRGNTASFGVQCQAADAIRDHLRECVPAEKVRELRDWAARMHGGQSDPIFKPYRRFEASLSDLLPEEER